VPRKIATGHTLDSIFYVFWLRFPTIFTSRDLVLPCALRETMIAGAQKKKKPQTGLF
jgi:hypothetical protein